MGGRKENDERDKVLEKRRALTMEVETIKDALNEKKLQDIGSKFTWDKEA